MFELMDSFSQTAVIKVIGVGGGGGNAVSHMAKCGIEGVEFICVNTDAQALKHSQVKTSLQIGCNITKGLGAGANPEVGRQAAMEDRDRIIELIEGCDMLFITAGMGGGTGTGEHRARVAAEMAVSSPLLEDINLAGAHGILVNVTAGLDLSIGEFEEVGSTVKQFAAEDATVVVGTVIEPEMQGELRVTVVATGLNRSKPKVAAPAQQAAAPTAPARRPGDVKLVAQRPGRAPAPDYSHLDRPAIHRQPQRAVGDGLRASFGSEDVLDIPAFLRRQAD
jgi:cell division GTPase FtsZ